MKTKRKITLKKSARGRPRYGHPWIYKSQIDHVETGTEDGELVSVQWEEHFVGVGYFNSCSEITIRLLTRHHEEIDSRFFCDRIKKAAALRQFAVKGTNARRLVSSEADDLPGLIVDQYADVLVVQFLTAGMEKLRQPVIEALEDTIPSRGLYEQSQSLSRRIEGLEEKTGWIRQDCAGEMDIYEGDIRYHLEFGKGHKTGFYLDQRENRLLFGGLGDRKSTRLNSSH